MAEVRFQPKQAPRSTGIDRTTQQKHRPAGSGAAVSSSPASSPQARKHAAAEAARAKGQGTALATTASPSTLNSPQGGPRMLDFSITAPEGQLLGELLSSGRGRCIQAINDPNSTDQTKADAKNALAMLEGLLSRLPS